MKQMQFPKKGTGRDALMKELDEMSVNDVDWESGRLFSLIYNPGRDVEEVACNAYYRFLMANGLSPFAFPSLLTMETEVISMVADLFHGDEAVGSMTTGGTESILMAVKSARDWAKENLQVTGTPELVMPVTAHPAFNKAAHYLGLKAVVVPVDDGFRADPKKMKDAITDNTVFMVGTAVTYPHGVIDPMEGLSKIALERNIWLHTDACLGGFMIPFLKKGGHPIPPFDFELSGVKSISADIHKYGYMPKGASTVMYRDKELRKYQIFAYADWPGGVYGTSSVSGARTGGAIAAAWSVMRYLGEEGYIRLAGKAMSATKKLIDGINNIPDLYVLGRPDATVFAFGSDTVNVYDLQDKMKQRNWLVESQHLPASIHVTVSPVHEDLVDEFLSDLREAVQEAAQVEEGSRSEEAVIYGVMGTLPDRSQAWELAINYLNDLYTLK